MNNKSLLNRLRNPHGLNAEEKRTSRLEAADLIEEAVGIIIRAEEVLPAFLSKKADVIFYEKAKKFIKKHRREWNARAKT